MVRWCSIHRRRKHDHDLEAATPGAVVQVMGERFSLHSSGTTHATVLWIIARFLYY